MLLHMLKGKIHRATVTQAELNYVGSITVDEALMEAAGIREYEKVAIVDVNNGARFETYVIAGERDSGTICLNGAAARCVSVGDKIIIMCYAMMTEQEADEVTNHPVRYGNVTLEAGKYKLTGEQALAYCRIRKIDTDFMRAYRQRTVMQSILKSVKSANPVKLLLMASKCAPYIETNLSKTDIMQIGVSALSCIGTMVETRVPFDSTWSYKTIQGNSVIGIDAEKNKEMLIDTIYNKTPDEIEQSEG